jgi:hypothetical protein
MTFNYNIMIFPNVQGINCADFDLQIMLDAAIIRHSDCSDYVPVLYFILLDRLNNYSHNGFVVGQKN